MDEATCAWAGCNSGSEATLGGRQLCPKHFYDLAAKRLEEHRRGLKRSAPAGAERTAVCQFLSEIISQTTALVISAKLLSRERRHQLLELSLSAAELHKRVQRSPRIPRNVPILIYREKDPGAGKELTNTIDVSKGGACVATSRLCVEKEEIWIEKPENRLRARARVAWVKKIAPLQFVVGLEILDCGDFWELEKNAPRKAR